MSVSPCPRTQVNLKLFTPRRIVLLFVIRDKTKTPPEVLMARPHVAPPIYDLRIHLRLTAPRLCALCAERR